MWQSALFIPATEPRFLAKAHERGARAIVLDLEASVVPGRKDEARSAIASAVQTLSGVGLEVLVRINMGWRIAFRDLEAAAIEGYPVSWCRMRETLCSWRQSTDT